MGTRMYLEPKQWFAWRPVRLVSGKWAWWRTIERRQYDFVVGYYYIGRGKEYTEIGAHLKWIVDV